MAAPVLSGSKTARWVLIAPLLLFSAVFVVWPFVSGLQTSLYGLTLRTPEATWEGFDNYSRLLQQESFWQAIWFTLGFAVTVTAIETVLGIGVAVLLNRRFPGKRGVFTALLVPIMVAPALMGVMFRLLLNSDIGLVPGLLSQFGIEIALFDPAAVVPLLIVLDVVQWTPFAFLIVYSGLQSFPTDTLEAAQIDGASRWQAFWHVVLPILQPVIFAAVFLRLIDALRTFDVIYVLTGGGPGTKTTTLSIFVYKTAFESGDFGLAAAAATVIMLLLLPLVPILVGRVTGGRHG